MLCRESVISLCCSVCNEGYKHYTPRQQWRLKFWPNQFSLLCSTAALAYTEEVSFLCNGNDQNFIHKIHISNLSHSLLIRLTVSVAFRSFPVEYYKRHLSWLRLSPSDSLSNHLLWYLNDILQCRSYKKNATVSNIVLSMVRNVLVIVRHVS
jgi:hypothetical protein